MSALSFETRLLIILGSAYILVFVGLLIYDLSKMKFQPINRLFWGVVGIIEIVALICE